MEVIRNSINVIGIADINELPDKLQEQMIQYSESETIFIPCDKAEVGDIFEIMIEIEITSKRIVETNINKTVILDGVKKYKIIYSEKSSSKANILYLDIPYNTFIKLPKNEIINKVSVYILDAYFSILSTRKIYSYLVLQLDVNKSKDYTNVGKNKNIDSVQNKYNFFRKENEMIY